MNIIWTNYSDVTVTLCVFITSFNQRLETCCNKHSAMTQCFIKY